jgi:Flp pilus assembly pilin Flp
MEGYGQILVIIFIFMIIHLSLSLMIGITKIDKNWDKYKCNPGVMPFASVFGKDTVSNFNECIKTQQADFMQIFLEPIYKSLEFFAKNGALFTSLFEDAKLFGLENQSEISNLSNTIKTRFNSVTNEMKFLFTRFKDTFGKVSGLIINLFNIVRVSVETASAANKEIFGTIIRAVT